MVGRFTASLLTQPVGNVGAALQEEAWEGVNPSREKIATVLAPVNAASSPSSPCSVLVEDSPLRAAAGGSGRSVDLRCARRLRACAGDGQTDASGGGSGRQIASMKIDAAAHPMLSASSRWWCPPLVVLVFALNEPPTREATDGTLYWIGRAFANLHVRGHGTERQTTARAGTRDQRQGDRRVHQEHRRNEAGLPRRGDPQRVALRATQAARGRDHRRPTMEERWQKSDSIDAWALAEQIRNGKIDCAVFKSPGKYSDLRAAVRAHQALVGDLVRAKNRLKAIYRSRGLQGMGTQVYEMDTRSQWLKKLPPHRRKLAEILSAELDAVSQVHKTAEQWLLEEAVRCSIVKLLATAPGIGMIRGAQIVAIVVSPDRFRTRQQFWSYCGLGVVTRSSSDWTLDRRGTWARRETTQTRGLNRNRHPILKAVFKGASLNIVQSMPKHVLHQDYQRMISAGMKPNLARITVARKIAAAVLAMWKNKEEYDPAKSQHKPDAA